MVTISLLLVLFMHSLWPNILFISIKRKDGIPKKAVVQGKNHIQMDKHPSFEIMMSEFLFPEEIEEQRNWREYIVYTKERSRALMNRGMA